ncbi:MAG: right-handed parallel beta-helix repeat-containing protein [Candidatus Bipolaricaulia bacterium]
MGTKRWLSIGGIALAVVAVAALSGLAATINVPADHATIQAAIDAALAGDTINVAAGNYAENVVVDKALTLQGAPGATIEPAAGCGVEIQASDITVDGFTINTIGLGAHGIYISVGATGLAITGNDITIGGESTAIYADAGPSQVAKSSGWTISGNTLNAANGCNLELYDVDAVTVDDNVFERTAGSNVIVSSELFDLTGPIVFTNNDVQGNDAGSMVAFVTDFQNYVTTTRADGTDTSMDDVTVTGNTFDGWDSRGLRIGDWGGDVTAVTVNYNSFLEPGRALDNMDAIGLDAKYNYWGDATGADPDTEANNPHGAAAAGGKVSDNVDFIPWYATATTTSTTQNVSVDHPGFSIIAYSDTITGALAAALAGDTIEVGNGTYQESLLIDKANLTLKSTNGRDVTTIENVGNAPSGQQCGIDVDADGFTLGGAAGHGFEIVGGTAGRLLQLTHGEDGVTLSHNKFDTTGAASTGISVGAAGATNLTITDNDFVAEDGDGSIWGPKVQDVTVNNNTFTGPASPTNGYAVQFAGVTASSPSTISENTITNYGMGVAVFNGEGTSDLLISDNNITGCITGIRLGQYSPSGAPLGDMTTVSVFGNTLTNNTTGLQINDGANVVCDQFAVKFNNFVGNTTGLNNQHTTKAVAAEENWWNSDSGPSGEGPGTGDAVSVNVAYDPWIQSTVEGSVTETVAAGGTLDAQAELGLEVDVAGAAVDVTVAGYTDNPGGAGFGTNAGFFDVFVPDVTGVTEITVRFYYPDTVVPPDEANLKASYWDGANWVECSNQTLNIADVGGYGGFIEVTITDTTIPTLADLTGTIFGSGWTQPASVFWYEDFEYSNQAAMETAGWEFAATPENLWHLTTEAAVPSMAYPNLVTFPSSDHAVWFANASAGSYGSSVAPASVSPEVRGQRTRIQPMGAGQGYPYGELTSPAIDVTGESSIDVSFKSYREVECYPQGHYDKTDVLVSFNDGAWQKVWGLDSTTCTGMREWLAAGGATIPVAVPAGATSMKIRFVFDAVDNLANDFLGWLIDDLKVSSAGPAGLRFEEEALPEGLVGEAYSATIHAVGGTVLETYAWRVISNSASSWLTVTPGTTTASLSGTPTLAGTYELCIGVSDDRGETYSDCYDIVVEQMVAGGKIFYDDFEIADGWAATGLWHRAENTPCVSPPYASPTHVYYYGNDATCRYATAGANSGTLTSPVIDVSGLVPASPLTIGWKYWREVESYNGAFDKSWVEYKFDNQPGWTQIWYDDSTQNQPVGGWHLVEATTDTAANDIIVPAGAVNLQVRFEFDTVDGYANNYVGWLIDDVKVIQQDDSVDPLTITSDCDDLPDGTVGTAYNAQLTATGGGMPYTWTWTAGQIPGLVLNADTGAITGTPTAAATYQCEFQVADVATTVDTLGPCETVIGAAPPCPCTLAAIDFENGVGSLVDDTLDPALWTITSLWHLADDGCVTCAELSDHYAYFGQDATCNYATGYQVLGYLTSPAIPIDACVTDIAIGFDHFREVEGYSGAFDRTSVQVRWDGGPWQVVWLRDSSDASPDCEQLVVGPIPVAGAQLEVSFGFNSIDYLFNQFTGWAVDDIWVKRVGVGCVVGGFVAPLRNVRILDETRDEVSVINVPNPVRDVHTTKFSVRGEDIAAIRIQIYDLNQNLVFEEEVSGNELTWHTVDRYGEFLANGVYFYRAQVLKGGVWLTTTFEKLVILR